LEVLAATTDLLVIAHPGARRWPRGRDDALVVTVTRSAGSDGTGFGTRLDRGDLRLQFGACRRRVLRRLFGAWQVTIVDPCWGRNDLLWPLLDRLGANRHPEPEDGGHRANPARLSFRPSLLVTAQAALGRHIREASGESIRAPLT